MTTDIDYARNRLLRTEAGDVLDRRFVNGDPVDIVVVEAHCANEWLEAQMDKRIWGKDRAGAKGFSAAATETNALYGGLERRR
jgi:hypothetical protein